MSHNQTKSGPVMSKQKNLQSEEGANYLIEEIKGHRKKPRRFAKDRKQEIDEVEGVGFGDIEEEEVYVSKKGRRGRLRGASYRVIEVRRITPKETQAVVYNLNRGEEQRIYEGKEKRTEFKPVQKRIIHSLGFSHEDVIEKAMGEGREIPPRVRRHYPKKFVDLPAEFEEIGGKTLKERLVETTRTTGATEERIEKWRKRVTWEMQKHMAYKAEADTRDEEWLCESAGTCVETGKDLIRFYQWLKSHVGEGKTFGGEEALNKRWNGEGEENPPQ